MLHRLPKTRKYNYQPRFAGKDTPDEDGPKSRIKFRKRYYSRKNKRSFIWLALLLFIVLFIFQYLRRLQPKTPDDIHLNRQELLR